MIYHILCYTNGQQHNIYSQNMQAQTSSPQASSNTSQISVRFGQFPNTNANSINLVISADYCSNKVENKRFNTAEYLSTEIPPNSVLFEIEAKEDGEELANKINQIREKSESMKQLEEAKQVKLNVIGKDKKVFIILTADQLEQQIQQFNKSINTEDMISQDEKWLEIVVKSNNTFAKVKDEIENRGVIPAFFESLLFSVKFNKSENIKQLVMKIFKSGFPEVVSSSLIDSFEHINIDVQLESASALENYPKIIENLKFLQINDDFKLIQSSLGNKLELFVFGKPVSFMASLTAQDLYVALDILFA